MNSIKNRVLLVLIGAGLLPFIAAFFLMKNKTSEAVVNCYFEKLQAVTAEVARQVATTMDRTANDLVSLRSNPKIVSEDTPMPERVEEMKRLVKAYYQFSDITLYGPDGFMLESTTDTEHPETEEFTKWFIDARDNERVKTSLPHRVNGQSGLHIKVYMPIRIKGIEGVCVMKARITFDGVWARTDGVDLGENGEMVLLDARGKILACEDKSRIFENFDNRLSDSFFANGGSGSYEDKEGNEYIYSSVVISSSETHVEDEWTLIALNPKSEVTAALRESNQFIYLIGGGAILIALMLGSGLARNLTDSVKSAADVAKEVVKGNLDVKMPSTGLRELDTMSNSFNSMIDEVRTHRYHLEQLVDSRTRRLRKSQQELEDLSAQLKATYESTQEGVLVMKLDGTILTANRRLSDLFEFIESPADMPYEAFEKHLCGCFENSKFEKLWHEAGSEVELVSDEEWEMTKPRNGALQIYSAPVRNSKGEIFARLWMFQDNTEQKQLQRGLQHAQKMEAIGRLAGGVAHDFNNLLTGIIGNLQLAELNPGKSGDSDGTDIRCIQAAKKAGQRAADLVKQLLGFSRRTHLELAHADANEVITDVNDLLRASLDPKVKVKLDLSGGLWGVKIDSTEMEQVVMNMCVNSSDAITDTGKGGTITLRTANRKITEEAIDLMKGERPGDFVIISIEDDGAGIPEHVLENIFEPFFTTKEQGKGTGLGLATSFGIVQQHGGWIHCTSEPGKGTTFDIYLPRQESPKLAKSGIAERKLIGGCETILLVDDEDVVRTVAEGILRHYGYKTLSASDGLEAIEQFKIHGSGIDLVLLDMTMPNLTGDETFARIRKEFGDTPVIVCSGYLVDLDEFGRPAGCRPQGFVQKPYAVKDFAMQIRDVLDQHATNNVS